MVTDDESPTQGKKSTMSKALITVLVSSTICFHFADHRTVIAQESNPVTTVRPVLPNLPGSYETGVIGTAKTVRHPVFRVANPSLPRLLTLSS